MAYAIAYSPEALDHLAALTGRQRARVVDGVEEQLEHQPLVETKNRKPMRPNRLAPWELRLGELRVYYEVVEGEAPAVLVRAIGVKRGSQVRIGGEIVEL